jgi:hypothetical protein
VEINCVTLYEENIAFLQKRPSPLKHITCKMIFHVNCRNEIACITSHVSFVPAGQETENFLAVCYTYVNLSALLVGGLVCKQTPIYLVPRALLLLLLLPVGGLV